MDLRNVWADRLLQLTAIGQVLEPEKKVFKPKLSLPRLDDYRKAPPQWFWDLFPSNFVTPAPPKIDALALKELAKKYGYPDYRTLDKVFRWIQNGADIGCKGKYR